MELPGHGFGKQHHDYDHDVFNSAGSTLATPHFGQRMGSTSEIQPSLFYTWQRELLAGAHTVFSTRRAPSRENELEAKISRLEARVARKDQIIAEVTEEYVTLKKNLGKPEWRLDCT